MSESTAKVAAAIVAAQAECKGIAKSGFNSFDKYKYATLEDYIDGVRPILAKHGLAMTFLAEEVVPLEGRKTAKGSTEHAVRVKCELTLLHSSGESMNFPTWGEGQDRADKAIYKAITGARKYAIASALNLSTSDDAENSDSGKADPGKPQSKFTPEIQAFLDTYDAAMVARGCPKPKAAIILIGMMKKKKMAIEAIPMDAQQKILDGVQAGQWDKYFKTESKQAA